MAELKSKWLDWNPETSTQRSDRSAKSPSGTSGTPLHRRFEKLNPQVAPTAKASHDPSTDHLDAPNTTVSDPGNNSERNYFSSPETPIRGTDKSDRSPDWGPDLNAVVRWLEKWEPTESRFELKKGVIVADAGRWRDALLMDVATGPGRGRDRWGAVHADLEAVAALFMEGRSRSPEQC